MKRRYRIKIETEKSGKKWYYAQEASTFFRFGWNTLDKDGYINDYGNIMFSSIITAEETIDKRLKNLKQKDSEKIISIEYKYLD